MAYKLIKDDEKESIFKRVGEIELSANQFISEAGDLINNLVEKYNTLNERVLELEKGEKKNEPKSITEKSKE